MKIAIEHTDHFVQVEGVAARIWTGRTESGIEVQCLITHIAVHDADDQAEFERELSARRAPLLQNAFPLRMLL